LHAQQISPHSEFRILHVMDKVSVGRSKIHGPARQIAYRVPFYPKERFKVMLCNLREEDAACDVLRASGVEVRSLHRGKFDPRTLLDLIQVVREWKPDLLHLHGYGSHNFGRLAGKCLRIPVILQEHFVDHRLPGYQKAIDRLLAGCVAKGLAVSKAVKRHMAEDRHLAADRIEVLLNGVPSEKSQPADPAFSAALRKGLGIPENARVVGIVGRLAEMKGHAFLLDAMATLAARRPDIRLLVVGEGPERAALEAKTQALGVADRVHFTGYQTDVIPYLSLMDVSVVASIFDEGFNTVGLESFAVGVPLVITDLECFQDIYAPDQNCLMVPVRDVPALVAAVERLLDEPVLREQLAAAGRRTAEGVRMERIAGEYVRVYTDLLAGRTDA
jgi:glycosyltransferase involved in cell wall biosynthesis